MSPAKHSLTMNPMGRRSFLSASASFAGAAFVPGAFAALAATGRIAKAAATNQLVAIADETTGLPLLKLPEGFRYLTFGWTGDRLEDGSPTPAAHDGMGVTTNRDGVLTLCRNHEVGPAQSPFLAGQSCYDAKAGGGCTSLSFDSAAGKWLSGWGSLAGTIANCAGGVTPWGTWLTCEESVVEDGDKDKSGVVVSLNLPHGYIFEVDPFGKNLPVPLKAMGRFVHEAVAMNPDTGIVYETEDRGSAGFYRFIPNTVGSLQDGGRLEMMVVKGEPDLRKESRVGHEFRTSWVKIDDPSLAHTPGSRDSQGVYSQGKALGATTFARLEGAGWGNDSVYFTATSGGHVGAGQVWKYHPASETLVLVYDSPSKELLDSPDNLCLSPRGGLIICEDPSRAPAMLHGLTNDGTLFPVAANNVDLTNSDLRFKDDFRGSEWSGCTFSPDGSWLFANIQKPGFTVAITGPWANLGL